MTKRFVPLTVLLNLMLAAVAVAESAAPRPADSVFVNGEIYLGNRKNPWATSLAIAGGRFVYVGDNVSSFIRPGTEVYDLGGKTVIPGLIDSHSHPGFVAISGRYHVLDDVSTLSTLLESIEAMVAENPDEQALIGGYWPNEFFGPLGPHKHVLDQIEPDRPVLLFDSWGHSIWANSAALKRAGVSRDTPDIVPGFSFYQKDEDGEPTGWITESAASVFLNNFLSITPAIEQDLLDYLNYYRSLGVTTVFDAGNFGLDKEVYSIVAKLDRRGLLPVRYHGAYTLFIPDDAVDAVDVLKQLGEEFNSKNIRIDTLKIFLDGVLETRTAAISQDYMDTPGNNGEALLDRTQIHKLILDLEAAGLNLHVHSVGDRATTMVLDAVEDAQNSLRREQSIRITICHLETVKETDFPRFRKLNVIANFTPHWWIGSDRSWVERGIGDESLRMQRAQPLIVDGATVTFSSDITDNLDWSSHRANPFLGIQVGHTRQDVGSSDNSPYFPPFGERLGRDDLLNGYTSNAAYQLGLENEIGTIAIGQHADFVVLDQNLFEVDKYRIHEIRPETVIVGGTVVFGDLSATGEH